MSTEPGDVGPLGAALLGHLPPPLADLARDEDPAALEQVLAGLLCRCQAAWPELVPDLPADGFLAHVGGHLEGPALRQALAALHAEDLYLAWACARGLPTALAALDARFLSQVPAFLGGGKGRPPPDPGLCDEVRQQLRERLLVPLPDGPPRIADYSGRGALAGWLRIATVRLSLNMRRNMDDKLAQHEGEDPTLLVRPGDDPELDYIRSRYRAEFKDAIQAALLSLPAEQRNLLRLSMVDGLSIDKLAVLFHISRATAARWLQAARQAVVEHTRQLLQQRLRLSPSDMDSIARVLHSQMHLSIARCLDNGAK